MVKKNFPLRPRHDRERFGEEVVGGRKMVRYHPDIAEDILDRVAGGEKLKDIVASDPERFPAWTTFMNWTRRYPDLLRAYEAALEVSALAFEEKALDLADELAGANAFTQTKVQAYKAAMDQYRWSAEKRNPKRYGSKSQVAAIVPIQINTNLDLGVGTRGEDVYSYEVTPSGEVEPFSEAPIEAEIVPEEPDEAPTGPKAPIKPPPVRTSKEKFTNQHTWGVNKTPPKSPGRPKKGHKSPAALAKTIANRQNALLRRQEKEKE